MRFRLDYKERLKRMNRRILMALKRDLMKVKTNKKENVDEIKISKIRNSIREIEIELKGLEKERGSDIGFEEFETVGITMR